MLLDQLNPGESTEQPATNEAELETTEREEGESQLSEGQVNEGESDGAADSVDSDTDDDGTEQTPIEIDTLTGLAEQLDVEPDAIYRMKFGVSVDGQPAEVSLSEFKDSYVALETAKARQVEAETHRNETLEQIKTTRDALTNQYNYVAKLTEALESKLIPEGLRDEDPAQYLLRQKELADLKAVIESEHRQSIDELQKQHSGLAEQELANQRQKLMAALPHWKDEATRRADQQLMNRDLLSRGFTQTEVANASDARLLAMAHDAAKYREMMSKNPKQNRTPSKAKAKVLRAGSANNKATSAQQALKSAQEKFARTGNKGDFFKMKAAERAAKA